MATELKDCPFCGGEMQPFGPVQNNHPVNGCWLSSVSVKAHEYGQWNERAALATSGGNATPELPDLPLPELLEGEYGDLARGHTNDAMRAYGKACAAASAPNAALVAALKGALAVIDDYLAYTHDGDPWKEDARSMGEMDINDANNDGRIESWRAALSAAGQEP